MNSYKGGGKKGRGGRQLDEGEINGPSCTYKGHFTH
jgi:hypothetical protein